MPIKLSDHFTYLKLLRFTAPSIIVVIFTSIYSVIDGFFVAKFVGETPFAAVNIVWPFVMILGAIGFMLGSGGSALVAKTLGEKRPFRANQIFSMLIYTTLIFGILAAFLGLIIIKPLVGLFAVEGELLSECMTYAYILLPAIPALMLQVMFQSFTVTAERPKFGLAITVFAGVTNFILDALFILVWHWGLSGAAWATVMSQIIGGIVPLLYFAFPNKSLLHLGKTKFYARSLVKSCTNGASEFMSSISVSLVEMLYNYQMLRLIGEKGVVAYGIISYVNFIFLAAFLGYSVGCNPIVGYHYGAGNKNELHNLLHKSLKFVSVAAVILTIIAEFSAHAIASIFIGYNEALTNETAYGFRIYAISFLFAGFNIYATAFFTALNNGLISAIIAFCRTLLFTSLCIIILPIFFGINGIWTAVIITEILTLIISFGFIIKLRPQYGY